MIIGTGNDIVDIRRVERVMKRYGERFMQRCFTALEQKKAAARLNPIPTYAKRFAAKEACSKALGTGFRRGVFFADLRVTNLASGQPTMTLHGGALARLAALIPPGYAPHIAVSLTDEYPY